MVVLQFLTYFSVLIFIVAILARIIRIASAPVHLRWELYPVPHEKGRAHYGGSRLEETDWWTKKQHKDHLGELKVMIPEILFLKGVWEHNKELWLGSFPFHFALYILMKNIALFVLAAVLTLLGYSVVAESGGILAVIYWIIWALAIAGSAIGLLGSIRLLLARIMDNDLRKYSNASHYFNIILIGAIFCTSLFWIIFDSSFVENLTGFYVGLITFSTMPELPNIAIANIIISLIFIIYMPFTHMTHMVTKYFTYHQIRWEDEPNTPDSKIRAKVSEYLQMPVTWSAPHIGADGVKNWLVIASSAPSKEKKNEKE